MAGFIYNGHSTEEFLGDEGITVSFIDSSPEGYGMDRDMQGGNPTIFRPIPNEYGTLDSPADIEFTIVKCGLALFTRDEQIKIETWLTAPRFSVPLYFVPSGKKSITGPTPYYYGVFTHTEWIPGGKGFYGVKLTFRPTTIYPFMKGSNRVGLKGNEVTRKISIPVVNPDEYIYPTVTIKDNNGNFSVQNTSIDGDKKMELTLSSISNVQIDCRHCIITDLDTKKVLSFSQVGWTDVSDVTWLRLRPGMNELEIKGYGSAMISYEMPYKKVGGWFE